MLLQDGNRDIVEMGKVKGSVFMMKFRVSVFNIEILSCVFQLN